MCTFVPPECLIAFVTASCAMRSKLSLASSGSRRARPRAWISTSIPVPSVSCRQLFAFASYNAGPGKVASLRREAKASGLDPNKWFNNVELVAAEKIGMQTTTYVRNIYKYYVAYKLMTEVEAARRKARSAVKERG